MTDEHDPLDYPAQERAAADNAEEERRQRQKEISDLCKVMGSKEGRRFMWRLLSDAGVYRLSFDVDAVVMAFNEGNRNAGLRHLNDMMTACPQLYAQMLTEQREEKERDEQRIAARRKQSGASR
jgi:hypothetical protein